MEYGSALRRQRLVRLPGALACALAFFALARFAAGAPAPPPAPPPRETMLLRGGWFALGLGAEAPDPTPQSLRNVPPAARRVVWPGPMTVGASDSPASVTMLFWKPFEAPRRWNGKAVWLVIPRVEGPARFYLNGAPLEPDERAGGGPADIAVSHLIKPGDSNVLVIRLLGAANARRQLQADPPRLVAGSSPHLAAILVRPPSNTGVFWVEARLRRPLPAGARIAPPGDDGDLYSVLFEVFEGPPERRGAIVPEATVESARINPAHTSVSAPLPVRAWRPWRPEDPALWTIRATLLREGAALDRLEITTGFANPVIREGRLWLAEEPVELACLSLPPALVNWAENGAWAEAGAGESAFSESESGMTLAYVARRRRVFWESALARLSAAGFTLVRIEDRAPEALLDAADRVGMLVEAGFQPRDRHEIRSRPDGLRAAAAMSEVLQRDQAHPSLVWWRVEAQAPATHLNALARMCVLLDPRRPAMAVRAGDTRIQRPGLVFFEGPETPGLLLETLELSEITSSAQAWPVLALDPGEESLEGRTPDFRWAPGVDSLAPESLDRLAGRLRMARVNPRLAGVGARLPMPPWSRAWLPPPARIPPVEEFLWPLRDAATSATLASALCDPVLLIDPRVTHLPPGRTVTVEIGWAPGRGQPPPEEAELILRLLPGKAGGPSAAAPLAEARRVLRGRETFARWERAARVSLELRLEKEDYRGAACLVAELRPLPDGGAQIPPLVSAPVRLRIE